MTAIAAARPRRPRVTLGHRVRVVSGVLVCLLFLFPVFWMVLTSFKQQVDIFTNPPTFFFQPTLDQYIVSMRRTDSAVRPSLFALDQMMEITVCLLLFSL